MVDIRSGSMSTRSRWFWKFFDPILLRMQSRMEHLNTLDPPRAQATRYAACATYGQRVVLLSTAEIVNDGLQEDLHIGDFCHIAGQLVIKRSGGKLRFGSHCFVGPQTRIWATNE